MPRTRQANVGFEYSPMPSLRLTLDLVHARGDNFMNVRDINAPVPNPFFNSSQPVSSSNPLIRRPDLRYGSIFRYDSTGESRHQSASFGLAWQLRDVFALNMSYTLSKTEDNYIDWLTEFSPTNTFDPEAEMATSNQDQRHRIVLSAVYNTKNLSNWWLKDWTIALIARLVSGRPYSILTGIDADYGVVGGSPVGNGDGGASAADRPLGLERNSEATSFVRNVDLRIARTFRLRKKMALEIIGEAFNVFNHYNISKVQNVLGSSFETPIVQSNVDFNRQFQAGIKFTF